MKKLLLVVSFMVLVSVLVWSTGCGAPTPSPKPSPAPSATAKPSPEPAATAKPSPAAPPPAPSPTGLPAGWPKAMTITTPSAGASISVYGTAVAKIIETKLKIATAPLNTSGSLEAAVAMIKGDAQLTATSGAEVIYAIQNKAPLPAGSAGIMRGLFWGEYGSDTTFVVRADSNINSIADLKGKRVMASRPGQALYEDNWRATLEAYGMTEKDITLMPALGQAEAAQALKEGRADCIFQASATPAPAYVELANATPIRIVSLSDAAVKNVLDKLPWTMKKVIPAGAYKGMDKEAVITTALAGTMVRKDLPDDLVYAIAKAVDENIGELTSVHPSFKTWTIKGLANTPYGIYHAGAFKYFSEKGYLLPESIAKHKAFLTQVGTDK